MSKEMTRKIKSSSLNCPNFCQNSARLKRNRYYYLTNYQVLLDKILIFLLQESSENAMDLSKEVTITEHLYSLEELCQKLNTNLEKGLSQSEAETRHKRDGPNAFSPPKMTPGWILFLRELATGFAIIIWLAAIASFICYAIELLPQDVSHLF